MGCEIHIMRERVLPSGQAEFMGTVEIPRWSRLFAMMGNTQRAGWLEAGETALDLHDLPENMSGEVFAQVGPIMLNRERDGEDDIVHHPGCATFGQMMRLIYWAKALDRDLNYHFGALMGLRPDERIIFYFDN